MTENLFFIKKVHKDLENMNNFSVNPLFGAVEIEKEMEIEMLGEIRKEKTERQGKI